MDSNSFTFAQKLPTLAVFSAFSAAVLATAVSTNYVLLAVILDSGGGSATSTNYTLQQSSIGQAFNATVSLSSSYTLLQGVADTEIDFDGDGIADNVDTDIDNDDMPNSWEAANGLDPYDVNDGILDSDGDGRSNADEFFDGGNPQLADTGDVNSDGVSNISDLLLLSQYLINIKTADAATISRGDFNRDGELSLYDFLALEKQLINN